MTNLLDLQISKVEQSSEDINVINNKPSRLLIIN